MILEPGAGPLCWFYPCPRRPRTTATVWTAAGTGYRPSQVRACRRHAHHTAYCTPPDERAADALDALPAAPPGRRRRPGGG